MKYLVDAQLPKTLSRILNLRDCNAIHTLDLPLANRTPDSEINIICVSEDRIIITKDADFLRSHIINGIPPKLLLIKTGNISNNELIILFENYLSKIEELFELHSLIEVRKNLLIIHK